MDNNNFKEKYRARELKREDILQFVNADLTLTLDDYSKNLIVDYMYYIQK